MKKIIMYAADKDGCGFYRMFQPAKYLSKKYDIEILHSIRDTDKADVYVFQRQYSNSIGVAEVMRKKYPKALFVYEVDDDFFNLPMSNAAHDLYMNPVARAGIIRYLNICDVVQVSTPHLAKVYGRFNKNVKVIPNFIDLDLIKKRQKSDKLTIGFAGGYGHWMDMIMIYPAIKSILMKNPNVKFCAIGYDGRTPNGNMYAHLPQNQFTYLEGESDIQKYYDKLNIDIGLCPLENNKFNRSKSDIKFIEYSVTGAATICTKLEPYLTTGHCITALHIDSHGEKTVKWEKAIQRLIDDESLRNKIRDNSYEYTINHRDIEKNIYLYENIYC